MKTMTCAQMGGECDAKLTGATAEEIIMNGMKHLEEAHPQMAADIKSMSATDPAMVAWSGKFQKDFDAASEI
jgi:predicted small metal-binding protein